MAKLVTGTYGEALFELAVDEKREQELLDEALCYKQILGDNKEFTLMMNHPKILKEEKSQSLEKICEGNFSREFTGFLLLVLQKDRYAEIEGILDFFIARMKEHMKIGNAYVTTAVSLKDSQKKAIEAKLLDTTKYQKMEITYSEDESLIGGMIIRIGDRVVDSSIRTKLEKLTRSLSQIQV